MNNRVSKHDIDSCYLGLWRIGTSESYAKAHAQDFARNTKGMVTRVLLKGDNDEISALGAKIQKLMPFMGILGYTDPFQQAMEIYQDMWRMQGELAKWDIGIGVALVLTDVLSTKEEMTNWVQGQLERMIEIPNDLDDIDASEKLAKAILSFELNAHFAPTFLHVPQLMRYQYEAEVKDVLGIPDFIVFAKGVLMYEKSALETFAAIVKRDYGLDIQDSLDDEDLGKWIGQLLFNAHSQTEQNLYSSD